MASGSTSIIAEPITAESELSSLSDYCESESESELQSNREQNRPVLSLLEKPKSLKPSDLARKRKTNPPKGKKRSFRSSALKCKVKVCPARRVNEFPNKHLTVILGKLFCSACWETLAVKKSTVSNHVRSSKHLTSKEKFKFKKAREESIALSLK